MQQIQYTSQEQNKKHKRPDNHISHYFQPGQPLFVLVKNALYLIREGKRPSSIQLLTTGRLLLPPEADAADRRKEEQNTTAYIHQLVRSRKGGGEEDKTHHKAILNPQIDFASRHTPLDAAIQFL